MKSFCFVLRTLMALAILHSPVAFGGTTNLVRIANFNFTPAVITITNGDSIRWSNTVALTPHDSTSSGSLWASGQLSPPNTFTFTFNNAGTFPYFCNTHRITAPQQTGTVSVVQGRVNALPTVGIATPTNNSVFTAPATFSVIANASDTDGQVSSVQFLRGTTSLFIDTQNPYTTTVSNLAAGSYTLFAIATDNDGGKSTNSIGITVLSPPTPVTIVNPVLNGNTIQFSFSTEAARRYTVESASPIRPFQWGPVTNFSGNGSSATVRDSLGTDSRFYRVGVQ